MVHTVNEGVRIELSSSHESSESRVFSGFPVAC